MERASRYNILFVDGTETLLYNTASGAFAALDDAARTVYEGFLQADAVPNPDDASDRTAALVRDLEDAGFLTQNSPAEELQRLRDRFEAARADRTSLMLVLAPTYACNYRCPYCYEQGLPMLHDVMEHDVMDAIVGFIGKRYEEFPFSSLTVQWYGGDPSLALPQVKRLSQMMMGFCDERGVDYRAMILTNGNLIDDDAAAILARCRVKAAMLTIDGFEETHNKRRVPADDANSFQRVMNAARLFLEHGIGVNAIMNVDRVNWPEYRPLRDKLRDDLGIDLACGRLSDCGRFFGTAPFCKPDFDLFSPQEFATLEHEEFARDGFDAQAIEAKLAAPPTFCNGQRRNNFLIDCKGDVYMCDGYAGRADHVAFNLLDESDPSEEQLNVISHDPFQNAQCAACRLLPICLGNCNWERETEIMQCHPLKYTMADYLKDLRTCYPQPAEGVTVLKR